MSDKPMVTMENVSKHYKLGVYSSRHDGLRHRIENALRAPFRGRSDQAPKGEDKSQFWALQKVDLTVSRAEVVGIIGRNGAGKSTLLKILSRITEPTKGRIRICGRVASLLEVGTGFHAELTGRENIFLNGAILGMRKAEIKAKFDEIVAFAGVERFIDTPVKRYSSGMYVRLAFAVAAHLEPEILIIDEVLAVGDAEFQKKCLSRMNEIAHTHGRTILFVSHNMAAIQNLCSRCVLLHQGEVRADGAPDRVINQYITEVMPSEVTNETLSGQKNRSGNGLVRFTRFHLEDANGNDIQCAMSGMDVTFVFSYQVTGPNWPKRVDVGFSVHTGADQLLFVLYSSYGSQYLDPPARTGTFRCRVKKLPLAAGRYLVGARIVVDHDEADWPRDGVGYLDVEHGDFYGTGSSGFNGVSPFLVDGEWDVVGTGDASKVREVIQQG